MSSSVEICNMALIKVGATRISSLSGTEKSAELCNALLQPIIDDVLSSFDWKCARTRSPALTQDSTAPNFQYDYRYGLPTSPYCLSIREVHYGDDGDKLTYWVQEGRYILTNQDNDDDDLYLLYTGRIVDHTQLPSHVVQAVVAILAWKLSYSLSPKAELKESLRVEAVGTDGNGGALLEAKQVEQSTGYQESEEGSTSWADEGR